MRKALLMCSVPVALALLLQVSSAKADGLVEGTVGAKGFLGGNLFTTPADKPPGDGLGFRGSAGGMGFGVGAYGEVRVIKVIGLELGLTYDQSALYRNVTYNSVVKVQEKLDTTNLRIPVLVKGILPVPFGRLSVFLGPEFVMAQDAEGKVEIKSGGAGAAPTLHATKKNSTLLTMGLGLTIELPAKLELPIELRASKNMSQDAEWAKRVELQSQTEYSVVAQSSWDFRLGAGLGYRF